MRIKFDTDGEPTKNLIGYINMAFMNLAISLQREKKKNGRSFYSDIDDTDSLQAVQPLSPLSQEPYHIAAEKDTCEFIALEIEKLTPLHKQVIKLRYIHELEYWQIASLLNVPEGTVKSRMHRGHERIKKSLEGALV
jgi:RNA polymerase sigma-70 factor (ECF subfamily)